MLKRILYTLHRLLGTLLSILFLVWFLSGFVMLYHGFPKVTPKDKYQHIEALASDIPNLDSIIDDLPYCDRITGVDLVSKINQPTLILKTTDSLYQISLDATQEIAPLKYSQIEKYARNWSPSPIAHTDTLYKLDQWIPFGKLKGDFPIYKFHFADHSHSQLYISSQTGEALQFTNSDSRFWAWLGAIPHWVYFTSLRQDSSLWVNVVIALSALGSLMCLAGLSLGVYVVVKRYKNKRKLETPYRKFVYKWHHITGFIFGLFVFTFVFSGMMSLAQVPQWMVKEHNPSIVLDLYKTKLPLPAQEYPLSPQKVLATYPHQVKSIQWSAFGNIPTYRAVIQDSLQFIDASTDKVRPLHLTESDIVDWFLTRYNETMTISLMNDYDNYYYHRKIKLPLPVFKVQLEDPDNSAFYINPKTGEIRYFNNNARFRKWTYQALHSFNIKYLYDRPVLWNLVMWTTMIGGTLVSLTGVWLGWRYTKRKIRKWTRPKNEC